MDKEVQDIPDSFPLRGRVSIKRGSEKRNNKRTGSDLPSFGGGHQGGSTSLQGPPELNEVKRWRSLTI